MEINGIGNQNQENGIRKIQLRKPRCPKVKTASYPIALSFILNFIRQYIIVFTALDTYHTEWNFSKSVRNLNFHGKKCSNLTLKKIYFIFFIFLWHLVVCCELAAAVSIKSICVCLYFRLETQNVCRDFGIRLSRNSFHTSFFPFLYFHFFYFRVILVSLHSSDIYALQKVPLLQFVNVFFIFSFYVTKILVQVVILYTQEKQENVAS